MAVQWDRHLAGPTKRPNISDRTSEMVYLAICSEVIYSVLRLGDIQEVS